MHISIPQDFLKIFSMTVFITHFYKRLLGLSSMIYEEKLKKIPTLKNMDKMVDDNF